MSMRVMLDDRVCPVDADTVGEAVAAAASRAQESGRLVVEVVVDGEQWEQPDPAALHPADRTAKLVSITSADATELVSEALGEAADVLVEAGDLQKQAGELLQRGEDEPAMSKLADAVACWLSVQQAVSMSIDVMQSQDVPLPEESKLESSVSELGTHLEMVRDCLRHRDSLGLSDALLYDLPQAAERWSELLGVLRGAIIELDGR